MVDQRTTGRNRHDRRARRVWLLRAATVSVAIAGFVIGLEILLRVLPTHEGKHTMPVDDARPFAHLEPNRTFTWSRDWNFSIVNEVRVNNAGFVSDFDYDSDAPDPLLAVIGDSYIEALMVPFWQTCHGRLARDLAPTSRVYSFGLSGAPLSQYLAYARHARDTYRPNGLIVVVIGNDFDQSLYAHRGFLGFHYFVPGQTGSGLDLKRLNYAPNFRSNFRYRLARSSSIARYMANNLNLYHAMAQIEGWIFGRPAVMRHGSPPETVDSKIVIDSKLAIDAFLEQLPGYSGLDPGRILFVVDGVRYAESLKTAKVGFVDEMRRHFIANARRQGYETIDMQPLFIAHHREHRRRFEWPQDSHWNALGHELCRDAVARSELLSKTFSRLRSTRTGTAGER